MPSFEIERMVFKLGHTLIAGVDEVGRGTLAGPVMAGAVILPSKVSETADWLRFINDSKKLTPLQRERATQKIEQNALGIGIGISSPSEIDSLGIVAASKLAMLRAVDMLSPQPHFLLIDYVSLEESNLPYRSVVGGDGISYSIAAASIAAKVARDNLMVKADKLYPHYGFHMHKGYGTTFHLQTLNRLGPSPIHRLSFAPVKQANIHRNKGVE